MIKIYNEKIKEQKNFWNHCLFHPTDAIEDAWGKRILDQIAQDGACKTVRIYTMFEDIVYFDGNDEMQFDFRISDLRMDYLVEKGFDLVLAYGGMPDCIARDNNGKQSNSKNKTRYKGKLWNTSPPKTPVLWEEVCYQCTKHFVERYGEKRVSGWYCHCFNEPDCASFFMADEPHDTMRRVEEYCEMYEAFVKGVRRACKSIPVGGPALSWSTYFLENFLKIVKEKELELNYIALHFYGTDPAYLNSGEHGLSVSGNMQRQQPKLDIIRACGFGNTPILVDEWGASTMGFFNREECKILMFRETEINSAYFVRFIRDLIRAELPLEKLMICLSGQHEMVEDFSGFRNFFTLNFIKKPIYNAYVLASKLGSQLLKAAQDNANIALIPTKTETDGYALLLSYGAENFLEDIADLQERIEFEEDITDKTVTVWAIDKEHTNPYRLYEKMGWKDLTKEQIDVLREEGNLKPVSVSKGKDCVSLHLTAGATFLITVE